MSRHPAGQRRLSSWRYAGIVACVVCATAGLTFAQTGSDRPARPQSRDAAHDRQTPSDREQAALSFVERHYPPLMEVLIYLKENRDRQYQRAIADLDKSRQRLAQIRERSPERYELELEAWRLKSEIQLLSARLAMEDSPSLRQQLKQAVERQLANRLALLELERKLAAQRLAKLESTLERLKNRRAEEAERLTNQLIARVQRMSKTRTRAGDAARKPNGRKKSKPEKKKDDE